MVDEALLFSEYKFLLVVQSSWMTVMWLICINFKNGSMVDFGWPSGFFFMAVYYLITGEGWIYRRMLICIPLILCGLRFMVGWFRRKHHYKEDARWEMWRERWRKGEGWFSIKNVSVNFLVFYYAQSLYNVFFVSFPIIMMTNNKTEQFNYCNEGVGLCIWLLSFIIENTADITLTRFKVKNKGKKLVCKEGLWYYSRHPNYFAELLLWIAYFIMCLNSVNNTYEYAVLSVLPTGAYYFLVHFTGVWMAEQGSVKNRGQEYIDYQATTNMIFPLVSKIITQ